MANDRRDTLETLLKFTVDRPALSLAQQGVEAIKRELTKLGPSAELGVRGVRSGFRVLGRDVDKAKRDVASLKSDLRDLGNITARPKVEVSGADRADAFGKVSTAFSGFAGGAGALGLGGEGGLRVVGDLAGALEQLEAFKVGITGLAAAFGGSLAVLGPLIAVAPLAVAGFKLITDEINKQAEATKVLIEARQRETDLQIESASAIRTRSKEENDALIQASRDRITALEEEAAFFQAQLDAAKQRQAEASAALGEGATSTELIAASRDVDQYTQSLRDNAAEYITASEEYQNLQNVIALGIARRDEERAAIEDSNRALEERAVEIRQTAQDQIEAANLIRTATSESVQAQLAGIEEQIAAFQVASVSAREAGLAYQEYDEKVGQLIERQELLTESVLPLIEAREREAEAAQRVLSFFQGIPKALAEAGSQALETARAVAEYGRVARESAQRLTEINTDYQRAVGEAARQREQALADAQREAGEARNEAIRDAQQEREDAEREHQQNIARIQRDFQRSSQQAIADRNVVAYTQAEQARKDALADENQNYANRRRDINRNLQETLRDINARLNQQRETIARQYSDQLRTAAEAANRARQIEYQKAQQELQIRQQSMQQQVQIVQQGTAAMGQAFANLFRSANTALNQRASLPAAAGTSLGSIVGGLIPRFANEGYITRSGLAYVDRGEVVMKASRLENIVNNSFTVNATSSRKIRQQVDRYLEGELRRVGL